MESKIMYLFARTPVHVGAGNSVGAVDMPVMRERHTGFPIIPGSSLKGVLSDFWNESGEGSKIVRSTDGEWLFGRGSDKDAKAGALLIGEARVLAFPVRSAKGCFAWITCPMVLRRYARDAGIELEGLPADLSDDQCWAPVSVQEKGNVILEEYVFKAAQEVPASLHESLTGFFKDNVLWQSLGQHLVVLNDSLFAFFAMNTCEVVTRIRVNDETGTVEQGGLFNQEQVPSETLFYSVVAAQKLGGEERNALSALGDKLKDEGGVIQVGGDETIGLGFCDVEVL
jgi:CRISPR-associated protein Cmr4